MDIEDRERQEILDTISMFEQIIQVMPNDQLALRSLYQNYRKIGEQEKSFSFFKQLAEAHPGSTPEEVEALIRETEVFAEHFPDECARLKESLLQESENETNAPPISAKNIAPATGSVIPKTPRSAMKSDLNEEIALAWNLFQQQLLTQEEYSNAVHDLTELSTQTNIETPSTLLHALSDIGFKQFERILNHIAEYTHTPLINLDNFEITREIFLRIPPGFTKRRAALAFGSIGDEIMVAVLNPTNKKLLADVQELTDCRIQPFLVSAAEYDKTFLALSNAIKEAEND